MHSPEGGKAIIVPTAYVANNKDTTIIAKSLIYDNMNQVSNDPKQKKLNAIKESIKREYLPPASNYYLLMLLMHIEDSTEIWKIARGMPEVRKNFIKNRLIIRESLMNEIRVLDSDSEKYRQMVNLADSTYNNLGVLETLSIKEKNVIERKVKKNIFNQKSSLLRRLKYIDSLKQ